MLGSMLIDPECIGQVLEKIKTSSSFYRHENQIIFDALIALYEKNRGGNLDAVLLRDELEKRKQLEEVGGVEYLAKIMESVPSSANVMYYAGIVKDKMLLREIIQATTDILNDAYDELGEPAEKLDQAERKIFAVTNKKISGTAASLKDLVSQAYELIQKREGKHITGIASGYYELDDLTCGLQNGEMIIIAGRPSMGKTALMLNIAEHIGVVEKIPLAIFSLEMGRQQLAERILCSNSEIDAQLVRKGMLSTEHYQKLVATCGELSAAPIYVDDTAGLTAEMYRAIVAVVDERVKEIRVTRRDFEELRSVIRDMGQMQAATQASLKELAQAQARTEERVGGLERAMEELAQAQARTEIALQNLSRQVGALSENLGFGLEDIARAILPSYLSWRYGVKVGSLDRKFYAVEGEAEPLEVNLYAKGWRDGQPITVLGEVKSRIHRREVESFRRTLDRLRQQIEGEIFPLIFGYFIHPSAVQAAGEEVVLIASYQPVTEFQAAEMESQERRLSD